MTLPTREELDELERQADNGELCIRQQLALIQAARELYGLREALEFLDEHTTLIDPRDEDRVYEPSRVFEFAKELGWKGSDGKR